MQTADRLRTDCELLFLGFENNGNIVVTYSFQICMVKTIVRSLRFTPTAFATALKETLILYRDQNSFLYDLA